MWSLSHYRFCRCVTHLLDFVQKRFIESTKGTNEKYLKDTTAPQGLSKSKGAVFMRGIASMNHLQSNISRRQLLQSGSLILAGSVLAPAHSLPASSGAPVYPLAEFGYGDVSLHSELHEKQRENTSLILMNMSEDSMLKPLRQMAGLPAPGEDLGGWYHYDPDWDFRKDTPGFAPAHAYGQWVSALARNYAITGDPAMRAKVLRLNRLYVETIQPGFYTKNRFPAYCYDKIVCGLIDSHKFANDPDAFAILDHTTDVASPLLSGKALDRDQQAMWRPSPDESWRWDESYTMSENLFLAWERGAGNRYRKMAGDYLDDQTYFETALPQRGRSCGQARLQLCKCVEFGHAGLPDKWKQTASTCRKKCFCHAAGTKLCNRWMGTG